MDPHVEKQPKDKKGIILKISIYIGVLLLLIIMYTLGHSTGQDNATITLEGKKVDLQVLNVSIKDAEEKLADLNQKMGSATTDLESKQSEYKEVVAIIEGKESVESDKATLEQEINTLDITLSSKQDEIKSAEATIEEKKEELASVEGKISEKKEEPKILSAGHFTVGKDLPANRYKVVPQRGQGNFFVNGGMKVNAMIGKGDFYEPEYVFYAEDGDEIEITFSAKFIPVE